MNFEISSTSFSIPNPIFAKTIFLIFEELFLFGPKIKFTKNIQQKITIFECFTRKKNNPDFSFKKKLNQFFEDFGEIFGQIYLINSFFLASLVFFENFGLVNLNGLDWLLKN